MRKLSKLGLLTLTATFALAGCDDFDGAASIGDDEGSFAIVMQPESGTAAFESGTAAFRIGSSDVAGARVPLSAVTSIMLPIGEVEAEGPGGWHEAGSIDADIDLMALPADGIEVLDSSLPQGSYTMLRFWLTDEPTVTLSEDITVGRTVFEAGTYPLDIPSAEQAGVRLHAAFDVDEEGEVLTVLFDGDATVRHVTATGSGVLKIAPVLRVENDEGEEVGDLDDDEDDADDDDEEDGDDEAEFEGIVASTSADGFTLEDGTVVVLTDETEIEGDLLSLGAVADAVANGEEVEAEGEGELDADGTTIIASEVEFEVDDDDGDGEVDDEDDGEAEAEGLVTGVDRSATTFAIDEDGETVTVVMTDETVVEGEDGLDSFEEMADAFDAGTSVRAEAEGQWDADGRLVAAEVEFETDEEDEEDDDEEDEEEEDEEDEA